MKIAILGTRGIPNNYGGFEQFAEYLSYGFAQKGHEVYVYNSHNHVYQEKTWNSVHIIHCYDPEYKIGTAGQFIYDLNCIRDARKRNFDIIFQLGYTSSSVFSFLFPKASVIVTNMDGLEWKRTKYGNSTRKFLKYAEKLAVKKSDYLIADSIGIKNYLREAYQVDSEYIPYGAHIFKNPDPEVIKPYQVEPYGYDMLMARLEPENSIEIILDGVVMSSSTRSFLVVGNFKTSYGNYLVQKYSNTGRIVFVGGVYDITVVNNLRYFSNLYFHGHTVGGTNPSLLEAMASGALIASSNNEFNASILEQDAYYFKTASEAEAILNTVIKNEEEQVKIESNLRKIEKLYSWDIIIDSHEVFFNKLLAER